MRSQLVSRVDRRDEGVRRVRHRVQHTAVSGRRGRGNRNNGYVIADAGRRARFTANDLK